MEFLKFIKKNKKGQFVFEESGIVDYILEGTGMNSLAYVMGIKKRSIFVKIKDKQLKYIKDDSFEVEDE